MNERDGYSAIMIEITSGAYHDALVLIKIFFQ
jgi:hypothetical protein